MKANTKSTRNELERMVAKCEATLDTILATNAGQQAEAWATKALREAKDARGSFDDGQFQYVLPAFNAASEYRVIAASFIV